MTPLEWLDEAQLAHHMALQFTDNAGRLAVATPRTPFGALRRSTSLRAVQKGAKGWKQIAAALGISGGRVSTLDD